MTPSFLTSFDDTLPILPPLGRDSGAIVNQIPGSSASPSSSSNSIPSSGVANSPSSSTSSGFTSFFGPRGIAIILGLILIAGSILLFLGDDIAGAVKVASKVTG